MMCEQENIRNESAEIIGQLNEKDNQENNANGNENINVNERFRLFKSQINQIVSNALGRETSSLSSDDFKNEKQIKTKSEKIVIKKSNIDGNESSEIIRELKENDETKKQIDDETRFRLYKLKIREIVSRALGKDTTSNQSMPSKEVEDEKQINATSSVSSESNIKVSQVITKKEEKQTMMKLVNTN